MRCRDPSDNLVILLGIDNGNIIRFLVTNEYIARVLSSGTRRHDEGQDKGGEALVLMIAYRADQSSQLSARLLISAAAGIFILPFFLCSATAGQLADAMDKARLIRLIKLLEIPVMLVAAGGVLAGSTATLLALLFVMGIQAAFFGLLK